MKLRTLIEILSLNKDDFNTSISYQIEIVSIYLNEDPELLWDKDIDYIVNNYNIVNNILHSESKSNNEILINNEVFRKIPFNKLTLGEFIDLDYYDKQSDGLLNIIMVLYRRYKQDDELSPIIFEKYGDFFEIRKEHFLELNILDVLGVKNEFNNWKNKLYDNYKGLFDMPYEDEDEDEDDIKETLSVKQAKYKEKQKSQFNWENTLLNLTNNDLTKIDKLFDMEIILFFNLLSSIKIN